MRDPSTPKIGYLRLFDELVQLPQQLRDARIGRDQRHGGGMERDEGNGGGKMAAEPEGTRRREGAEQSSETTPIYNPYMVKDTPSLLICIKSHAHPLLCCMLFKLRPH